MFSFVIGGKADPFFREKCALLCCCEEEPSIAKNWNLLLR